MNERVPQWAKTGRNVSAVISILGLLGIIEHARRQEGAPELPVDFDVVAWMFLLGAAAAAGFIAAGAVFGSWKKPTQSPS